MTTLLKKLNPTNICPHKLKRLDLEGAPVEVVLYDIYGMANDIKTGQTDKGEWTQFKGHFEAITPDGEVFQSGAVFLQQPFQDMLQSELLNAKREDGAASVQFACRISIVRPKEGKPSMTGYEYRCAPLIESEKESPLAKLRALVAEKRKLLPAPASETRKTKAGSA